MSFLSLLTKELRLRFRSERTIWILIAYVLLLSAVGLIAIVNITSNPNPYGNPVLIFSTLGLMLFTLLTVIQLVLIIFVTPAFTATAINGEKERQTYDLLLSSQLSGPALAGGKLLAGLMNTLLLVAAALPLFSLVFFFGGVSLAQFFIALALFCTTAWLVGNISLFLSALLARPAASTATAYIVCLLWIGFPLLIMVSGVTILNSSTITQFFAVTANIHPLLALISIEPGANLSNPGWLLLSPWQICAIVNTLAGGLIFWVTTRLVRPRLAVPKKRLLRRMVQPKSSMLSR